MEFKYFDVIHALGVQDYIIQHSGGRKGLLNQGLLESILEHIQNDLYYPNLEDKLCHLFFSINKHHAFNDGNKRSSISLSAYFLEINGADFIVNKYIHTRKHKNNDFNENKYSTEFTKILVLTKINEYISIRPDIIVVTIIP